MKYKIMIFGLLTLFVICLAGCSASHNDGVTDLRLFMLDSNEFKEYNFLWFPNTYTDSDTSGYRVLTEKISDDSIDKSKYEPIKEGETYRLKLFTVDWLVSASMLRWGSLGDYGAFVLEPDVLFWDSGKIMVKVYFSKDLKGRYVLKGKRKQ
ncbi:MAG: hypothetical protein PHN88_08065 [Ignavibacteria bacterium]|nr:hypothetical protein [Ignavibacteria bacterium]